TAACPRGALCTGATRPVGAVPKFLDALVEAEFISADTGFGLGVLPQRQAGFSRARPEHPARRRYTRTFPRLGPRGIPVEVALPHTQRVRASARILVGAQGIPQSPCWPTLAGLNR